jgi:hypothetical protein
LKLPGFDGDTLVCPVGSDDAADWKPALAYPPFKKALLDSLATVPAPMPALPPMPALLPMSPPAPIELPKPAAMPVPAPFPLPLPAAPAAAPAPAPAPAPMPKPEPAAKTVPCPRCARANLDDARFCNSCGGRMDALMVGRMEDISPPAPFLPPDSFPPPASFPSAAPVEPPKAAAPAFDPFAHLDPMLSFPAAAAPEPARRPLQPGKMGQLADLEASAPAAIPVEAVPPASYPPSNASLAPDPAPVSASVPLWKRPLVLAALAVFTLVAAGIAYVSLNKPAPVETIALAPSAPMPMPEPAPAVVEPAKIEAPLLTTTPDRSSLPPSASARTRKAAAKAQPPKGAPKRAPKRARKPRPKPAPVPDADGGGDTFIESHADEPKPAPKASGKRAAKAAKQARARADQNGKDPLLEALLTDATEPSGAAAEPAAEPPAGEAAPPAGEKAPPMIGQRPFSLPGLQRPPSASDRAAAPQARAPRPSSEEAAPPATDPLESLALAEPGKSQPTPGIEDEPVKSAEGDQLALVQVHEQFDFCAQLLAQGAFGDHYDTCLCKDARDAAPYRGRRGFYASAKKKEASAGHLETTAKILSSKIDGGSAKVTARWKASSGDKGRTSSQTWKLEDGLWCQAP